MDSRARTSTTEDPSGNTIKRHAARDLKTGVAQISGNADSKELKMMTHSVRTAYESFVHLLGSTTIGPRLAVVEDDDEARERAPPVADQTYSELNARVIKQKYHGDVQALTLVHSVESLLNLCLNLKVSYVLHDEEQHSKTSEDIGNRCSKMHKRNLKHMHKLNIEVADALAELEDHLENSLVY